MTAWLDTVLDVLNHANEDAALSLLCSTLGCSGAVSVPLMECDLDARDALAYSRTLNELGREQESVEVFYAVVHQLASVVPQVAVNRALWLGPQGSQLTH